MAFADANANKNSIPYRCSGLPPQVTITQVFQLGFGVPSDATEGDSLTKARGSDSIKFIADIPGEGEGAFEEELPTWGGPEPPS